MPNPTSLDFEIIPLNCGVLITTGEWRRLRSFLKKRGLVMTIPAVPKGEVADGKIGRPKK